MWEKGACLKGAHSERDVLGSGQPKLIADSGRFLQELAPQDGTDYMDVGKVAFICLPFQEELFSCPSFLWGKGWDYGEGEDRKIGLLQGYSYTCFVSGLSQKARGEGVPDPQGRGQLR